MNIAYLWESDILVKQLKTGMYWPTEQLDFNFFSLPAFVVVGANSFSSLVPGLVHVRALLSTTCSHG